MLPQNRSSVLVALLVAACVALILSGCGGGSPVSPVSVQPTGTNVGGGTASVGATITIPAQSLPVVDAQGQATGRTANTPAVTVASGKPFTLPVTISDNTAITGIGIKFASDNGSVTCADIAAGDAFPAQQATVVKNVTGKAGAIVMLSPVAGPTRKGAVLATLTLVANSSNPIFTISGELAGSHAESIGLINPQSSGAVHTMSTGVKGVGDIYGDGYPSVRSANGIMLAYIGSVVPAPSDAVYYDANGDGKIDIRDANKVMLRYVGAQTGAWPIVLFSTVTVTGLVKDNLTSAVVPGASVTVAGGPAAITDSTGRFTTTNTVSGGSSAVAVTGSADLNFSANMVVATDFNPSDIGTIFVTSNTISGTLYLADGVTAVGNFAIAIGTLNATTGLFSATGSVTTNSTGQFAFRGIPAGRQQIIAGPLANPSDPTDALMAYKYLTTTAGTSTTGLSVLFSDGPPPPPT